MTFRWLKGPDKLAIKVRIELGKVSSQKKLLGQFWRFSFLIHQSFEINPNSTLPSYRQWRRYIVYLF